MTTVYPTKGYLQFTTSYAQVLAIWLVYPTKGYLQFTTDNVYVPEPLKCTRPRAICNSQLTMEIDLIAKKCTRPRAICNSQPCCARNFRIMQCTRPRAICNSQH